MNALTPIPDQLVNTDHVGHGSPAMLREEIAQHLSTLAMTAENGIRYAMCADDFGLTYSVRHITAYLRAILADLSSLQDEKKRKREGA